MKITPEKAIEYLDNCAKKHHGSREDHVILQLSIQALQGAVSKLGEVVEANDELQKTIDAFAAESDSQATESD